MTCQFVIILFPEGENHFLRKFFHLLLRYQAKDLVGRIFEIERESAFFTSLTDLIGISNRILADSVI